jgi:hypothetical protein
MLEIVVWRREKIYSGVDEKRLAINNRKPLI